MGGDLAYGNGFAACYQRWDDWLKFLEENLVTSEGNMIPLLASIGNHEAGGFAKVGELDEPFYKAYFVHEPLLGRSPFDLTRYSSHLLGSNSMIVALDTGVIESISGSQKIWMKEELKEHKERKVKFAIYHAGLYPSVRPYSGEIHTRLRVHWLPIFDRYNLTVGLENHDHAYKRTIPLSNGKKTSSGFYF